MNAGEACRQALGVLRVLDAQTDTDPLDYALCIGRLNDMMALWESELLSLGWQPVTLPTDVLSIPGNANIPVIYNLAFYLQDDYGSVMSPASIAIAENSKNQLWGNQESTTTNVCDYGDLPRGQGQRVGYSWRDGFYR
jgi:hypothetical protein